MNPKALESKLAEFETVWSQGELCRASVQQLMERHVAAGVAINRKIALGKGSTRAESNELRAVFESYPSALRGFATQLLRAAVLADEIKKEFES